MRGYECISYRCDYNVTLQPSRAQRRKSKIDSDDISAAGEPSVTAVTGFETQELNAQFYSPASVYLHYSIYCAAYAGHAHLLVQSLFCHECAVR
jgi:hypothetical protein